VNYGLPSLRGKLIGASLEAAIMELTLKLESQGFVETGGNVRGALNAIGENAGYIRQGIARLKGQDTD